MKTVEDLEKIGFKKIGYWFIDNKNKLQYQIDNFENLSKDHLLYSFESDLIVKYIGITEKTIKERLGNYKNGSSKSAGSTNRNVYNNIFETILNGFKINIWILKENATCDFHGYEISLATGIEKSLIKEFDLKENLWNSRGTRRNKATNNYKKENDKYLLSQQSNQTILKLGSEARKGWLIFKKEIDDKLPEVSSQMSICYNDKIINGCRFTRSLSNKKINGGYDLKKIFENDFKNQDFVKVTIINSSSVKIEKVKNE